MEMPRRNHTRVAAAEKLATRFGHIVAYDEFEIILADGTAVWLLGIVDEASMYMLAAPFVNTARSAFTWKQCQEILERAWISWAGAPECLRFDQAK